MPLVKPTIVTRAQWGARQADVALYDATNETDLAKIYTRLTVHHEARPAPERMTLEQGKARMREIQAQHQAQGWSDVGYHYVIDRAGRIYSARTLFGPGAHVAGRNTGNLGICLMGALHQQPPTLAQVESLIDLMAWFCHRLSISPDQIQGHRDHLATECPGEHLYRMLPEIRTQVRLLLP
ncbi:MAG: hypothetical protein AMXMBFR33_20060 [Candidatus Xenobia bacterium]